MRPATLRWPTILTPLISTTLPGCAPSTLPAALDREVDDDRARPHRAHHLGGDQARGRTPRNERGGDDDVLLLDVLGHQRGLLGLVVLGHFLGVAAGGLGVLEFLVLDREEFRAQAFDLLLGGGRTSVAVTTAPSRRAVAIACRPATPTPMTNTARAGTVPAAVIIIGSARPYSADASITAR
jgi:hypothetical protein